MKSHKEMNLVVASFIFSIGLIIAAYLVSSAITNVAKGIYNEGNNNPTVLDNNPLESYELLVDAGWFYLYDTQTGQIWKKPDNDDPEASWVMVKHFTKE